MADDPRIEPIKAHIGRWLRGVHSPDLAERLLITADAWDPLRALLADEGRAVEALGSAADELLRGYADEFDDDDQRYVVRLMLAALREVAGL